MRITILLIGLAVSITAFAQEEEKTDSVAVKETENVDPTEEIKEGPKVELENIKEEGNDYDRDEIYSRGKRRHYYRNDRNKIHTLSRHSYHSGGFGSIAFKWGIFRARPQFYYRISNFSGKYRYFFVILDTFRILYPRFKKRS